MSPQRIGIDCRFSGFKTGLGRYTRCLVSELVKSDAVSFVLFVRSHSEPWLSNMKELPQVTFVETSIPHYSFREQFSFPGLIRRASIDLLFSPHFNVPLRCPVPFVCTVHDLILHHYPNEAGMWKQLAYRFLLRSAVGHARDIIAVSRFTEHELKNISTNDISEKITVIPEGVTAEFRESTNTEQAAVLQKFGIEQPYFLYVGNAKEHKNVQTLIDAHRALQNDSLLVLVTDGKEVERVQISPRVRILRDVPDENLPTLYGAALAFVTASLYEGFCLPIIEAEACGCPVIASNRGAIPEVASKATVLVEPTVEALTRAMRSPPSKHMSRASRSWKEVARETQRILLSIS